ncbi:MAG: hypothetical protein WC635_14375 [Bacteriovorax sp.]|jgi:hypothetical protein
MFKRIASFTLLMFFLLGSASVEARSKKVKKKKKGHKTYKVSMLKRKSRRIPRGNGPDLKSITTDSPYTEETNNGINPVESAQPGI